MRKYLIEKDLKKVLSKLFKKNTNLYVAVMKKIEGILCCENPEHYKNLKVPLQEFKRVHVGSFILMFKYVKEEDKILFYDLTHHDDAYK